MSNYCSEHGKTYYQNCIQCKYAGNWGLTSEERIGSMTTADPSKMIGIPGDSITVEDLNFLRNVKTKDTGGVKHDTGKPDLSYISYELMEEVAYVREFGAKKYARSNWKKGFKLTRSCAAALRHIFSFLSGETLDKESGRSHLAHAVCCLEHAIYDMKHHPENDDRDKAVDNK